jgi:hypothetical protein
MLKETISFVILSIYASTCSAVCITQPILPGGIIDVDINDPGVIAAAYNANILASNPKNLEYVIKTAKSQILNGIKYYLNILYPENMLSCDYEVIYLNWINEYSLVVNRCSFIDLVFTDGTIES